MVKKKDRVITEYHLNQHRPDQPQLAIHDLRSYLTEHQKDTTRPHIHSFYQVIWFKKGSGIHFVDFKGHRVQGSLLFFIARDQVHYFDQRTDYEGVLIHFNELFVGSKDGGVGFPAGLDLFGNPYQAPFCPVDKGTAMLLEAYLQLIKTELNNEGTFAREALLSIYLKALLIQAQRSKNEFEKRAGNTSFMPDEKRRLLNHFVNLVDQHYTKGLTVSGYAGLLHISARTLSDLTRQILNKTPSQMIQERITLEAQRLLLHSGLNINQIGYRLGFDDPSYFVKYFKKHIRRSPSAFRKSLS
ncbi:helix-turn-helix domain-containing protein [Niabella aurantiaca]|uniref:helix-turn-helix domain-containing protein n=1 Tax=Niabella aurantiaca TaxID=379900 RepID=UPI00035E5058|nr:AraC family transcriptional regulator [Niabella aurantiaca]